MTPDMKIADHNNQEIMKPYKGCSNLQHLAFYECMNYDLFVNVNDSKYKKRKQRTTCSIMPSYLHS